ncbi:DMT family transporter [Marinomonas shanghaiensis]|jgi:drug/metabolite transporter, DME family|uniref:DMT family transporter n=1 Tax=Marinomonas shanghaiensis TaxID=2202418 RepID=UPI0018E4E4C9|nr:EamA family transporter [Marinomonas shanghaiensis]
MMMVAKVLVSEAIGTEETAQQISVGRGLLCVMCAAMAWGTGGAVAAMLYQSSGLGPIAVSFWRFLIGVCILAVFAFLMTSRLKRAEMSHFMKKYRGRLVVIGIGSAVYQAAYFAAVQYSGLAVATVVTLGLGPIFMALGSYVALGERMAKAGLLTMIFAILGLALLTGGSDMRPSSHLGMAFACLSALGYASVTILTRAMSLRRHADQFNVTFLGMIVGTVCLLPLAMFEGVIPMTERLLSSFLFLGYLGLVPTAMAYILFNTGLSSVRATTASVIVLVEPLTATMIAVLFLGEQLTQLALLGMTILMLSVVVLALAERRGVVSATGDV